MAKKEIPYDDFKLTSTWTCHTVYYYNSYGSFNSSKNTPGYVQYAEKTPRFIVDLPVGAKVKSAVVSASHTGGLFGGELMIAGQTVPYLGGSVTLESPDVSAGYLDVVFRWTAWTDTSDAHSSSYPTSNGSSSQSKDTPHESTTNVSNIKLVVEYEHSGIIYHAENDVLVPYQIYHAENDQLVPYLLFKAENNTLIPY